MFDLRALLSRDISVKDGNDVSVVEFYGCRLGLGSVRDAEEMLAVVRQMSHTSAPALAFNGVRLVLALLFVVSVFCTLHIL